jgi:uncharacterized membrane protein YtjA (UPF0391 family)
MGNLLYWAVVFLVVAVVAAVLGFGGVAGTAMAGAQLLFWVAIVLFIISLVAGLFRRGMRGRLPPFAPLVAQSAKNRAVSGTTRQ